MFLRQSSDLSEIEDNQLIRKFLETDDLTFLGELFQRYTHLVFGTCLKYLKDEEDSKDASMDIFEKLQSALKGQEIANFGGWLFVITKNHCLMKLRARKTKLSHEKELVADSMEISYSLHHNSEGDKELSLMALEKALPQLPLEQNRCIELFYLKGKCYQQIASATGYDLKKVKSYLQNGKRNLKTLLEKENG